jgi:hypothetical protein
LLDERVTYKDVYEHGIITHTCLLKLVTISAHNRMPYMLYSAILDPEYSECPAKDYTLSGNKF